MTSTPTTPAQTFASLWITNDHRDYREELHLGFDTAWRGRPVSVTMHADRYQHTSGISDWRIYATEAREGHAPILDNGRTGRSLGDHLTDTARSRLSDELRPLVTDWLASPAYTVARTNALAEMIYRELTGTVTTYRPTSKARELLETYGAEITADQVAHLEHLAGTLETYASAAGAALPKLETGADQ